MNKKYILQPRSNTSVSVVFEFDLNGFLIMFKLTGNFNDQQHRWLLINIPTRQEMIKHFDGKLFRVKEVPIDLSFDAFWKAYNYKVGKKVMAENLWKRMSEEERIKAMTYIARYDQEIRQSGVQKAYPTTYLNQKYYEA